MSTDLAAVSSLAAVAKRSPPEQNQACVMLFRRRPHIRSTLRDWPLLALFYTFRSIVGERPERRSQTWSSHILLTTVLSRPLKFWNGLSNCARRR